MAKQAMFRQLAMAPRRSAPGALEPSTEPSSESNPFRHRMGAEVEVRTAAAVATPHDSSADCAVSLETSSSTRLEALTKCLGLIRPQEDADSYSTGSRAADLGSDVAALVVVVGVVGAAAVTFTAFEEELLLLLNPTAMIHCSNTAAAVGRLVVDFDRCC